MTGRPTSYNQELADTICQRLAGGESLRAICVGGQGRYAIYALCEPGTETVRYVGQSSCPERRFKAHCRGDKSARQTRRHNWLSSLADQGKVPEMFVLDWSDDWDRAERFWVSVFRQAGYSLVNGNEGGKDTSMVRGDRNISPWKGRRTPLQIARSEMKSIIKELQRAGKPESASRVNDRLSEMNQAVKDMEKRLGREKAKLVLNYQMAVSNPRAYGALPE